MGIDIVPLTWQAALATGSSHLRHRRSGGGRDRVPPEVLIGAPALLPADRLLTPDGGVDPRCFADLAVTDPTGG
jgi:hypothetical protein